MKKFTEKCGKMLRRALPFAAAVLLLAQAACLPTGKTEEIISSTPLEEPPLVLAGGRVADYSPDKAFEDGMTIVVDNSIKSGKERFFDFFEKAKAGEDASLLLYKLLRENSEAYGIEKLVSSGGGVKLCAYSDIDQLDGEAQFTRGFKFAKEERRTFSGGYYTKCFMLSNVENASVDGYYSVLASSSSNPDTTILQESIIYTYSTLPLNEN